MPGKMVRGLRIKGFDSVLLFSHLLVLLLSFSIYLAPYIAPSTFPFFGFIPIFFPIIVLFNFFLVGLLFLKNKKLGLLFLIPTLGLLPPLTGSYQFFGKKVESQPDLKLITFNAHYMKEEGFEEFFKKEDADVVVLQEVWYTNRRFNRVKDEVFSDYYYESNSLNQIFSRFPIIEYQPIYSEMPEISAYAEYADLDTGSDTVRLINVYLEPMKIDKKLIREGVSSTEDAKTNSVILKNKLTRGFLRHQQQIKRIIPYIQNSPHPVILAGDLNSVPYSYEYQQFSFYLKDAYLEVGRSAGTSFHDFKFPLRLDYVFHTGEILPVSYRVLRDVKISDHYPVVAEFKLP